MSDDTKEYECEDCGAYAEQVECPYNQEMGGETMLVFLCDRCYDDRMHDV